MNSFMNTRNEPVIIGVDHGYGNIKTTYCCFKTGVTCYDKEPTFKSNLLTYGGRYYLVGEEHKEFTADKMADNDYYILTLAAIARELNIRKLTCARVHLAAGLPLTWVSEQKETFRAYLLQNEAADFSFRGVDYHIEFAGADIFPQGFAAVADRLREFKGTNMLCDIGNGTMNVMYINDCRPQEKKCFTEKYGTNQCILAVRENLMKLYGVSVEESVIDRVIRHRKRRPVIAHKPPYSLCRFIVLNPFSVSLPLLFASPMFSLSAGAGKREGGQAAVRYPTLPAPRNTPCDLPRG